MCIYEPRVPTKQEVETIKIAYKVVVVRNGKMEPVYWNGNKIEFKIGKRNQVKSRRGRDENTKGFHLFINLAEAENWLIGINTCPLKVIKCKLEGLKYIGRTSFNNDVVIIASRITPLEIVLETNYNE